MKAAAKETGPWPAPIDVPAAKPVRPKWTGRWELLALFAVLAALAWIVLPGMFTEYVTSYRCIVCYALRFERDRGDVTRYETPQETEESRFYRSVATEPHVHRWTKTRDSVERSRLTGEPFAFATRDVSPLYWLYGEERKELLRSRLRRDGSLEPFEAELHAIQDAWERGDEEETGRLYAPIREAAFGSVDSSAES